MTRSLKKGPYVEHHLAAKLSKLSAEDKKKPQKTRSRRSTITPDMVGLTLEVHNGKKFTPVYITEDHVGHKLGEFSHTRTFKTHPVKK